MTFCYLGCSSRWGFKFHEHVAHLTSSSTQALHLLDKGEQDSAVFSCTSWCCTSVFLPVQKDRKLFAHSSSLSRSFYRLALPSQVSSSPLSLVSSANIVRLQLSTTVFRNTQFCKLFLIKSSCVAVV